MAKKQPRRARHVPQRSCVVCRRKLEKRSLTRVVMTPVEAEDGTLHLVIDPTGKQNGRGAYLCDQRTCWEKAARSAVLDKALRTSLTPADREIIIAHKPENPETGE